MKSKFERAFKELAYKEIPDRWDEIKEKTKSATGTEKKTDNVKFNVKSIVPIAASIAIVILAVSVAASMNGRTVLPEKDGVPGIISYTDAGNGEYSTTGSNQIEENKWTAAANITDETQSRQNPTSGTTRKAIDAQSTTAVMTTRAELFVEPDWDRLSMPGKFRGVVFNREDLGREYVYPWWSESEARITKREASLLLHDYTLQNRNTKTDTLESASADIYSLGGFDKKLAIGVKFKGEDFPHIYINVSYMPENLGEFLTAVDYDKTVSYGGIELYAGTHFPVSSDNAADIRKYLFADRSVKNANDNPSGLYVTVIVSCEELGIINKTLRIYESGYITTNLIGYQYTFFVGKGKTDAFLKNSYNISFSDIAKMKNEPNDTTMNGTTAVSGTPVPETTMKILVETSKAQIPE